MPDFCALIRNFRRQAPAARMIGEFAVKQGSRVVVSRLSRFLPAEGFRAAPENGSKAFDALGDEGIATSQGQFCAPSAEPFANYDSYTSRQVLERLRTASQSERNQVLEYEVSHRARETILSALTLSSDASANSAAH